MREFNVLLNIILGGFATLAAVVTIWSLAVAFCRRTTPTVRTVAYRVFRVAWTTFVVSAAAAIIQLYRDGLL